MVELMLVKWLESPDTDDLNLSTLVHQILSHLTETGGMSAQSLFDALVKTGPFRKVTPDIDNLSPKKPLDFGSESLAVVYGRTGSGKSGYTRILKKMCGARSARDLLSNAFTATPTPQSCKIAYDLEGVSKEVTWTPAGGVLPDLSSVEIYDSDCARVYTNEENQVLYSPPVLALFDGLIAACGRMEEVIKAEIAALPSKKPIAPLETVGTRAGEWYSRLSVTTPRSEIDSRCAWDEATEKELRDVRRRLTEPNPADQATIIPLLVDFPFMPTPNTPENANVTVKMDYVRASSSLKQSVNILGQDGYSVGPCPLPFDNGAMGFIRLRVGAGPTTAS